MDKILVLGSNSFSGASFVAYALRQGWEIIGASRSPEPHDCFLPYKWSEDFKDRFVFHQVDINTDLARLREIIITEKPSYVVNYASQSMVGQSWDFPLHWYQTNLISQLKLHDFLRTQEYLKKYVHISTPEVYGSCEGVVEENIVYNPSTPYATSRAACDMHLMNYYSNYDFPVVFTRAANVYGAGQQLYRIIPKTILSIKKGKRLPLHGGGHSVRSFIHIDDVSNATLQIMQNAKPPSIYHVTTDHFISIRDLIALICERLNVRFEDSVEITEDRPGKDSAYTLSFEKIKNEFGWRSMVLLDNGIEAAVHWAEENFDILKNQPLDYIHKQ